MPVPDTPLAIDFAQSNRQPEEVPAFFCGALKVPEPHIRHAE